MNEAQALQTQARRYCEAQIIAHNKNAQELKAKPHLPQEINTGKQLLLQYYGRAEILQEILHDIEKIDVDSVDNLEDTRDRILKAIRTAQRTTPRANMGQTHIQFSQSKLQPQTVIAINDEREICCAYIQGLSKEQLTAVEELPYQRVLSIPESKHLWSQFRQTWDIKGYLWHPLKPSRQGNIIAFHTESFEIFCESTSLIEMLRDRGIHRLWELREYGIEYEQEVSLLNPTYNGYEGYWSSEKLDWIIYASHEESITIGGWLLEEVQSKWPDWEHHRWSI